MNKKTIGIVLAVLGVLAIAFDFLAVPLHIAHPGFGLKQIALLVVGVIILGVGLVLWLSKKT
jgi:hypothetical protein